MRSNDKFNDIPIGEINMVLGQTTGCYLDDIIYVPVSPQLVEFIQINFKEQALREGKSYEAQGFIRKVADHFERVHLEYKRRRAIKEEREKTGRGHQE